MDYAPEVQVKRAGDACVPGDPAQCPLVVLVASILSTVAPISPSRRSSALAVPVRSPEAPGGRARSLAHDLIGLAWRAICRWGAGTKFRALASVMASFVADDGGRLAVSNNAEADWSRWGSCPRFGASIVFGGRSETIRGLRDDGRGERFRQIDIHPDCARRPRVDHGHIQYAFSRADSGMGSAADPEDSDRDQVIAFVIEPAHGHNGSPHA